MNYGHFFGHSAAFARRILAMLFKGKSENERFANQPAWLREEMLDKAAQKRKMRNAKRWLENWRKS